MCVVGPDSSAHFAPINPKKLQQLNRPNSFPAQIAHFFRLHSTSIEETVVKLGPTGKKGASSHLKRGYFSAWTKHIRNFTNREDWLIQLGFF